MTLSRDTGAGRPQTDEPDAQGGLESVSRAERVASLTGIRAVAALLVMGTHAAYTTGKYTHGYVGLAFSRMEIGVPIFFVLSGFLLFGPWVRALAEDRPPPSMARYAWHRVRRIMPAYLITVLVAYLIYHYRTAGPNPGHTWTGLLRNVTLTQAYTDNYLYSYLHQGLTQMWSLAVEVAFYAVLPLLVYVLLVVLCRRRWQPRLLLMGLVALSVITPLWLTLVHITDWFPDGAKLWLPTFLLWFLGGMMLSVLAVTGGRWYALTCLPLALVCYFIVSTPLGGEPTTSPARLWEALAKSGFYAVIAVLMVGPLALANRGWYARALASRPMVWLGEISYEIFLIHLIVMEFAMTDVLHWRVYTGNIAALYVVTLIMTVPLAWLLHRFTRVRS
jgi:peptidoglycan/LPS O-acetylase OafA/YrhL